MSTFLQVSGAIFWLSLGAGGLWVGLCLSVDWFVRRSYRSRWLTLADKFEKMGRRTPEDWRLLAQAPLEDRLRTYQVPWERHS